MIPLFLVLGFRIGGHRNFRLWLPLFLIWLLLLPLVLVLLPLFFIGCLILRVNPLRAAATGWQILTGLAGTHIEIRDPENYILIRII